MTSLHPSESGIVQKYSVVNDRIINSLFGYYYVLTLSLKA